jgi:multiple antibiotic resistance protein
MGEFVLSAFVLLLIVIDPIGVVPLFTMLTATTTAVERRWIAVRGVLIAGGVLVFFALGGAPLLDYLNISHESFRIAGGVLLFLLAIDMLFARHSGLRSTTQSEQAEAEQRADISVFPLAIPLIAGPGAMTTVILLVGDSGPADARTWLVLAILATVLAITLGTLLLAGRLARALGETGTNVITRLLGILLAALALQFVIDGLRASFPMLAGAGSG